MRQKKRGMRIVMLVTNRGFEKVQYFPKFHKQGPHDSWQKHVYCVGKRTISEAQKK